MQEHHPNDFYYPPSQNAQIRFLFSILQELELHLELRELFQCKLQHFQLSSFIKIFQDQHQNSINGLYLSNFNIVLAFKISDMMCVFIKDKQQQEWLELKNQCTFLNFKTLSLRSQKIAAVKKKILQLVKDFSVKRTFAQRFKSRREDDNFEYILVQLIYYYYQREIFNKKYEFQSVTVIQDKLTQIKCIYRQFILDFSKQLRYLSRKHQQLNLIIDQQNTSRMIILISQKQINSKIKICLSQILRNIIQNGYKCSVQDLIQIADSTDIQAIRQSMYQSIILFQHSDKNAKEFLNKAIQLNKDIQNNQYFIQKRIIHQIGKQQGLNRPQIKGKYYQNIASVNSIQNYSFRNMVRIKHVQSQRDQQSSKYLSKILIQQQNGFQQKQSFVIHPEIILRTQIEGNDRSWKRGTFEQIKNLFAIAQKEGMLKKQDKDIYLRNKFMDKNEKNFSKGKLGSFLIDRMIAKTYFLISKNQKLTLRTIQKLIGSCIKTGLLFREVIYLQLQVTKQTIVQQFYRNLRDNKDTYQIYEDAEKIQLKKFTVNLSTNNLNKAQKGEIINEQIELIRVDAIAAIYYALLADIQSLSMFEQIRRTLFTSFYRYLQSQANQNSEYFNYFLRICCIKCYSQYFQKSIRQWKNILFNRCIEGLSHGKSKQLCLGYLVEQAERVNQHHLIFKDEQIYKVIQTIRNEEDRDSMKPMISIVLSYLLNPNLKEIRLSEFQKIKASTYFSLIKEQYYTAYLFNTQKLNNLKQLIDNNKIEQLISQYKKSIQSYNQNEKMHYIILLILFNISKQMFITQVNIFGPMLLDHSTFILSNHQFIFENQSEDGDKNSIAISEIVAHILYFTLKNDYSQSISLDSQTLKNMFIELRKGNLNTKIAICKTLQIYSSRSKLPITYLNLVKQHLDSDQQQIKIRIIFTYLNILKLINSNQSLSFNQLHTIIFKGQVYFDGFDISPKVNKEILEILLIYTERRDFQQFSQLGVFQIFKYFLISKQIHFVQNSLEVLCRYSSKFYIPMDVLEILDKIAENIQQCVQEKMEEIQKKKKKIYENLIANQQEITIKQIKLWVNRLLSCQNIEKGKVYLTTLIKISQNQNLPSSVFNIIELERCCQQFLNVENPNIEENIVKMTNKGVRLNTSLHFRKIIGRRLTPSSTNLIKIIYNLSFTQQIPVYIINSLLGFYQPQKMKGNEEKTKLIAKIFVNTYLNYQANHIQMQDKILESVNNKELLQITLPILLKRNYNQDNDYDINFLKQIMSFYNQTTNIMHKESISHLFTNQVVMKKLQTCKSINLNQLLKPERLTPVLQKNCSRGLQILGRKNLKRPEVQVVEIKVPIKEQQNIIFDITKVSGTFKQYLYESFSISKKILLISQIKDQLNEITNDKTDTLKRDYLYCRQDMQPILKQLNNIGSNLALQKGYSQIIRLIASINYNHTYEKDLTSNQQFIDLIQKQMIRGQLTIQICQIYAKIIENSKYNQQIFNNILQYVCSSQQQDVYFYAVVVLQKIIVHFKQQINQFIQKQHIKKLIKILSNNLFTCFQRNKYLSTECLKIIKCCLIQPYKEVASFDYPQKFAEIQKQLPLNKQIMKSNNEQQKYGLLLRSITYKICDDEASKIILYDLLHKVKQSTCISDMIEVLIEIYLNINNKTCFKNVYRFLKYFIFNTSFRKQIKQLANNIKNHRFEEDKLHKILVHHYAEKMHQITQISQQKIIQTSYGQDIEDIAIFFESLVSLQRQQRLQIINCVYMSEVSLKSIVKSEKISLDRICSLSLIKKLVHKFKINASISEEHQCCQLLSANLLNFHYQQLDSIFDLIKQKQINVQINDIIQLLQLISHFPKNQQEYLYRIMKQSFDKPQDTFFQNIVDINKKYFEQIAPKKETRQTMNCVQLIQIYPPIHKVHYQKNQEYELHQIKKYDQWNFIQNFHFKPTSKKLSDWKVTDFINWAREVKKSRFYSQRRYFLIQALSIIKAAIYPGSSNTQSLRDNQLLSCLIMLKQYNTQNTKGKLLQISTGQGKTTIICAVAIILALKGHQVNVVTTTSILAKRDVEQFQKIYKKFDIKVAHNIDYQQFSRGPKKCYECDVVYGQISQFQFDYLRDHYNNYGTLAGRKNTYAIVDEVDSMLIDDSSKISKISTNIAGIQKLQILYVLIWQKLLKIKSNIMQYEDKSYYFDGRIEEKQNIISFYYKNNRNKQVEIKDFKRYMEKVYKHQEQLISQIIQLQDCDQEIKKILLKAKAQIITEDIHIPVNFKDFVSKQYPKWVESALQAYHYQQNINYIIQDQCISPVDYDNTGKIENSTHWANGLHQFLQLKHYLKLTPQNLATNFISNITYFKLYEQIIGVTGTLGSEKAKQVLSLTYKVDIIIIPDSFQKYLIKYPEIISQNTQQWILNIVRQAQYQIHKNRGILIIGETIQDCNHIRYCLRDIGADKIILYTMNDKNQEDEIKQIGPKQIIIATNLAGRGTDIKTKSIEHFGGLHVILTFLPRNLRVEEQAKGRTSRNGNYGSCQIIINKLLHPNISDFANIIQIRDQQEKKNLDYFIQKQRPKIQMIDEIFLDFCQLLKQKRKQLKPTQIISQNENKISEYIKMINQKQSNSLLQYYISAIQQRWAFFLNNQFNPQTIKDNFQLFKQEIQHINRQENTINNPYYFVQIGYDLLNAKFNLLNPFKYFGNQNVIKAKQYFKKALDIDPRTVSALTGLGEICLRLKKHKEIQNLYEEIFKKKLDRYKQFALYFYQTADQLLKKQLKYLSLMHQYSVSGESSRKSLLKQIIDKSQILTIYQTNVRNIIKEINRSEKLITITQHNNAVNFVCYQEIRRKKQYQFLSNQQNNLQLKFHDLNSNANDQSAPVLKELEKLIDNFSEQSDFINLELKNISVDEINAYLLDSIIKKNLNYKQSFKFIKEYAKHKTDEANFKTFIHSKFNNQTRQFQGISPSLQYLSQNEYINDRYKITITPSQLQKQSFEEYKLTVTCKDVKDQIINKLICIVQCQSYSIQIYSAMINYKYQQICQFMQENQLSMLFVVQHSSEDGFSTKLQRKQAQFCKQNYQNETNKIILRVDNKKILEKIKDKFINLSLTISFIQCTKIKFFTNLQECKFNVLFSKIKGNSLAKISKIKQILKKMHLVQLKFPYDLIITKIKKEQLQALAFKSEIGTQDLKILQKRQFLDLFPKASAPLNQIYQYFQQGIGYTLIIQQQKKIPAQTILILSSICFIELVAGVFLLSIGNPIGLFFLIESVIEIFTVIQVANSRQFNWKAYIIFKLISVVLFSQPLALGLAASSILQSLGAFKAKLIQLSAQIVPTSPQMIAFLKKNMLKSKDANPIARFTQTNSIQYKKIIEKSVYDIVQEYFKDKIGARNILNKMGMLDFVDQAHFCKNQLCFDLKQIINSRQTEVRIQKMLEQVGARQQSGKMQEIINIKDSQQFKKIVHEKCLQFQIKLYQIQKNMPKFDELLNKYSNIGQTKARLVYEQLKRLGLSEQIIMIIDGKQKIYEFSTFHLEYLKLDGEDNQFKRKSIWYQNNKHQQCQIDIYKSITQELANLFMSKLLNFISISSFKQFGQLSNFKGKTIVSSPSAILEKDRDMQIMRRSSIIQQNLIHSNGKQLQEYICKYAQIVRIKPASPVDILLILEEFNLKIKLISEQDLANKIHLLQEPFLKYQRNKIKGFHFYNYQLHPNQQKTNKTVMDEGFFQICCLLNNKISIFALRKHYSSLILKNDKKIVDYLRSFNHLYSSEVQNQDAQHINDDQKRLIQKKLVGFRTIINNYQRCSLIQKIIQCEGCINEHVSIQSFKRGQQKIQVASINVSNKQDYKDKIEDLIDTIIEFNVQASMVLKRQKRRIDRQNYKQNIFDKIQIKVIINPIRRL